MPAPQSPSGTVLPRRTLLGLTAALPLAACAPGPTAGAPAAAGDGFPVTVAHAYGSTEIPAAPQRVVTLGYTDQDPLLAVGVAPVAIVDWFVDPPANNRWAWQEAAFGGAVPEVVGEREEYSLERLAALRPDLVVASYSGMTRERWEQVSRIAPTVAQPPGFAPYTAPWQAMTRQITTAVGRRTRGEELVADVERRIAAVRDAHPRWSRQSAVMMSFDTPNYFAFARGDVKADLLRALGFGLPAEIDRLAAGRSDTQISPERVDLLDVDRLVVYATNAAERDEVSARPEFRSLPVVAQGRTLFLLGSERTEPVAAAMGFSSVLSLPYTLDRLVPRLEALPEPTGR